MAGNLILGHLPPDRDGHLVDKKHMHCGVGGERRRMVSPGTPTYFGAGIKPCLCTALTLGGIFKFLPICGAFAIDTRRQDED
jgi:hypothetical protein